ncbi:hypothetical protein DL98DRAFT_22018 [Cadophora sp. DSE1049]|nr:hypothetical protein DL98DRAFT_22018 [Cadophora sp. DSE1049]
MQIIHVLISGVLVLSAQATSSEYTPQQTLVSNNQSTQQNPRKKVAIIGAGLAGATAAYYLHDSIRELQDVDITIFESSPQIGGRIKSIKYRGRTIEVGATAASNHDWCFLRAMKDVGLAPKVPDLGWYYRVVKTVGVWTGEELVSAGPHEPQCSTWWEMILKVWRDGMTAWHLRKISPPMSWDVVKLMWRYGLSAWKFHRAVSSDLAAWDNFGADVYSWETHTFDSLGSEVNKSGLSAPVLRSAGSYLRGLNLSASILDELVEPYARARFTQSLQAMRGIAAAIAYRDFFSRSLSVSDGNYRLVDRLITLSKSDLRLSSRVKEIQPGHTKRLSLGMESSLPEVTKGTHREEFDAVMIATPLHLSGKSFGAGVDIHMDSDASRGLLSERHVTHFVSSQELSPQFFNLPPGTRLPDTLLTTANSSNFPDIFSITLVDTITRIDQTGCSPPPASAPWDLEDCDTVIYEKLFRAVSSGIIDNQTLSKMIGSPTDYEFLFIHRQVWPYITPKDASHQFQTGKIELAPGLYYTGGGEDIISSLEMSCRMGFNAGMKAFNGVYDP